MSDSLNKSVAVCGLGRIGWLHAECCQSFGFQLAAICDEDPRILQEAQDRWGVPSFTDWRVMLKTVQADVVVIATPSHLHFEMTILALRAGFHVMVEKPAAANASEVRRMMAEAERAERMLTVCQTLRYQHDTQALKEFVETKFVGRLDHIALRRNTGLTRREDWQIWQRFNGGLLSNMGVHLVDAVLHVCGECRPKTVFASMRTMINKGDTEDAINIALDFEDGLFAEIEIYRGLLEKPIWELYGDQGTVMLRGPLPHGELRSVRIGEPETLEIIEFDQIPTNLENYYRDLQHHLALGQPPPISMESVLKLMQVVDAIRLSAAQRCSVDLSYEEDLAVI